ncbi:hypothetical protein CHU98_g8776 [Xylaria longipes]|nr:hypothetical protein CHU98_g8776 [Xylaria longipes]
MRAHTTRIDAVGRHSDHFRGPIGRHLCEIDVKSGYLNKPSTYSHGSWLRAKGGQPLMTRGWHEVVFAVSDEALAIPAVSPQLDDDVDHQKRQAMTECLLRGQAGE